MANLECYWFMLVPMESIIAYVSVVLHASLG